MAEAGPGPSTMELSPVVPASAKNLRVSRRVINLVNPADPNDFSDVSLGQTDSPNASTPRVMVRETTPLAQLSPNIAAYTPGIASEHGPKGILKHSGTPGSGNGVRFFPKNKFRVITPNQPTPKPSFFGQLIAATMPSMSPRRGPGNGDESWEQPGQEGEVSLIGSSVGSVDQSQLEDDEVENQTMTEEEPEEEEPWDGVPQVHSSPLSLPSALNTSTSFREESDSVDWKNQMPDDMSNLLAQHMPSMNESFSFGPEPSASTPTNAPSTSRPSTSTSPVPSPPKSSSQLFAPSHSSPRLPQPSPLRNVIFDGNSSISSEGPTDDNPTIRRHCSPLGLNEPRTEPETPTPALAARPFGTSIFADMSAEQAELSWPLARPGKDDETTFHSVFSEDNPLQFVPTTDRLSSPRNAQTPVAKGDITQFFDCTSSSPSSFSSSLIRTPSPINPSLLGPTKNLVDAHSAHALALSAELTLYKNLVGKLQVEVSERDGVLAELNLRALEGDMLKVQLADTKAEMARLKRMSSPASADRDLSLAQRGDSASPSPLAVKMRRQSSDQGALHPADRTTIAQAETRDLEIRLEGALADTAELRQRLHAAEEGHASVKAELGRERADATRREETLRDQLIAAQSASIPTADPERSQRAENNLRAQLEDALQRIRDLEVNLTELREVKISDEEEIARLHSSVDRVRGDRRKAEEMQTRIAELEGALRHEAAAREESAALRFDAQRQGQEALNSLEAESSAGRTLAEENEQLRQALQQSEARQAPTSSTDALQAEINKLRAESASKDLEIVNLQRRKEELKEDREMLNIALDSKQQELELIKRKFAVRGVAGCTPLGPSAKLNTPSTAGGEDYTPAPRKGRRVSSITLATPVPAGLGSVSKLPSGAAMTGSLRPGRMLRTRDVGGSVRRVSGVMDKVDEENRPPLVSVRGSVRRERQAVAA